MHHETVLLQTSALGKLTSYNRHKCSASASDFWSKHSNSAFYLTFEHIRMDRAKWLTARSNSRSLSLATETSCCRLDTMLCAFWSVDKWMGRETYELTLAVFEFRPRKGSSSATDTGQQFILGTSWGDWRGGQCLRLTLEVVHVACRCELPD